MREAPRRRGGWRALAGALIAVAVLGAAPRIAAALEPDALPEPLWWRASDRARLEREPLASLGGNPGLALESEWAPLLDGARGSRLERAMRVARLVGGAGRWTAGLEWSERMSITRGGEPSWGVGAGFARERHASMGARLVASRGSLAASLVATTERVGLAGGLAASLSRHWHAELGASSVPAAGRTDARWFDVTVGAPGRWRERRTFARLRGELGRAAAWLELASCDAVAGDVVAVGDALHPKLAWRTVGTGARWHARRTRWFAGIEHGMGREGFRVRRDGTSYAVAVAPVTSSLVQLRAARGAWEARAWGGRYGAEWAGDLALWPFDPLAAIAGTRRLGRSSLALAHSGASLDWRNSRRAFDGGLALWHLAPRARWESWQATFIGLGHDDESVGVERLDRAWLAGVRAAMRLPAPGSSIRVELVQWIPFGLHRAAPEPGGAPDPNGGGSAGHTESDRGGTLLRVSLASSHRAR